MRRIAISVLSVFVVFPALADARLPVVNLSAGGVSARAAFVIIEGIILVTDTDTSLDAPPGAQYPLVAIRQTGAVGIPLVAILLHVGECPEQEGNLPCIEMGIEQMKPEKVSVEGLAQPVAHFGLYPYVLPFTIVLERERIIIDMRIQGPTVGQPYLYAQCRSCCQPGQCITFDCNLLGRCRQVRRHNYNRYD